MGGTCDGFLGISIPPHVAPEVLGRPARRGWPPPFSTLRGPPLIPTSLSLLERLRGSDPDQGDWRRLHDIYQPLIARWLARIPGLGDEAADLAQEVLVVLVREIPRFRRAREGSFRAWLRLNTANRVRDEWKRRRRRPISGLDPVDGFLAQMAAPDGDLAWEWDLEHDRHVFRNLLAVVRPDFTPATWDAFRRFALDDVPAAEVARESGLSENAVLLAKSRVLKRLRAEAGDLLE